MSQPSPANSIRDRCSTQDIDEALLAVARCLGVNGHNTVYVSVPITTGKHFARWHRRQSDVGTAQYLARLEAEVVRRNLESAEPLIAQARMHWARHLVMAPTGLDKVPGWDQGDFHRFWTLFVRRHACAVVLAEGWQYSNGCSLEVATAVESNIPLYDHHFDRLDVYSVVGLVNEAIAELGKIGVDTGILTRAVTTVGQGLRS